MTSFNELPHDVKSYIFGLTPNPVETARLSKENLEIANERAQECFEKLNAAQDDVSPLLKSTIAQISSDSSITSLERIKKLYEVLKNSGYDDNRSLASLQPEQIKNAFKQLQENQNQALITILPKIAEAAKLTNPSITEPEEAQNWLQDNLDIIQNVTRLSLNRCKIKVLPPEIGQFTGLTELQINNTPLTTLPPQIGQLTNLERLNLHNNKFTSLPQDIEKLTHLEGIDLSHNQFEFLPQSLGKLTQLKALDASANILKAVPQEIGQLTKLERLLLDENQLIGLPQTIGNLTDLEVFTITDNPLNLLPAEISNLKKLKKFAIPDNPGLVSPQLPPGVLQRG